MNEEAALLSAIYADPDEDSVRLVYADWLQEHGDDARAEFIRVQCELARIRPEADPKRGVYRRKDGTSGYHSPPLFARWQELDRREGALWKANAKKWTGGLPRGQGVRVGLPVEWVLQIDPVMTVRVANNEWSYTFRRGFPEIAEGLPFGMIRPGLLLWLNGDSLWDLTPPAWLGPDPRPRAIVLESPATGSGHVVVGCGALRSVHLDQFRRSRSPHSVPTTPV